MVQLSDNPESDTRKDGADDYQTGFLFCFIYRTQNDVPVPPAPAPAVITLTTLQPVPTVELTPPAGSIRPSERQTRAGYPRATRCVLRSLYGLSPGVVQSNARAVSEGRISGLGRALPPSSKGERAAPGRKFAWGGKPSSGPSLAAPVPRDSKLRSRRGPSTIPAQHPLSTCWARNL